MRSPSLGASVRRSISWRTEDRDADGGAHEGDHTESVRTPVAGRTASGEPAWAGTAATATATTNTPANQGPGGCLAEDAMAATPNAAPARAGRQLLVAASGDEEAAAGDRQERTTALGGEEPGRLRQTAMRTRVGARRIRARGEGRRQRPTRPRRHTSAKWTTARVPALAWRRGTNARRARESSQGPERTEKRQCQRCLVACTAGQGTDCGERRGKGDQAGTEREKVCARCCRDRAGVPPQRQEAETAEHEGGLTIRRGRDQGGHQQHCGDQCDRPTPLRARSRRHASLRPQPARGRGRGGSRRSRRRGRPVRRR